MARRLLPSTRAAMTAARRSVLSLIHGSNYTIRGRASISSSLGYVRSMFFSTQVSPISKNRTRLRMWPDFIETFVFRPCGPTGRRRYERPPCLTVRVLSLELRSWPVRHSSSIAHTAFSLTKGPSTPRVPVLDWPRCPWR